jgi:hypothetical protein
VGALEVAARLLQVDLVGQLSELREDRHAVLRHRQEAAVHSGHVALGRRRPDLDDTVGEQAEQRRVVRQDADVALGRARNNDRRLTRPDSTVRGDELDVQGVRHEVPPR